MSFPTQAMLYNHLTSGRSLSTILIIHHTSESSTFILLPKEVFQQFLLHITIFTSSYFRKKYIHLTSERSPSTILIIHLTLERRAFILLPKEVFQWFFSFIKLPKEVNSSYLRNKSSNNSYFILPSYFRKKYIHLTSERSLSTFLIIRRTSERSTFILLLKVVF